MKSRYEIQIQRIMKTTDCLNLIQDSTGNHYDQFEKGSKTEKEVIQNIYICSKKLNGLETGRYAYRQLLSQLIWPVCRYTFQNNLLGFIIRIITVGRGNDGCSVVYDSLRPHGLQSATLLCSWDFPGKNTEVSCHFLLQNILPTRGSNLRLLYWQAGSLPLSHQGWPLSTSVAINYLFTVNAKWISQATRTLAFPL